MRTRTLWAAGLLAMTLMIAACASGRRAGGAGADPLPSWKDGDAKAAVLAFLDEAASAPKAERVAVFDNDGTLWCEQPAYVQARFAVDRVKEMAASHPEWRTRQPFKAVLEGDEKTLAAGGEKAIVEILAATHAGMTTEEFDAQVRGWLASARHPKTGRPYTEMVYQPMIEVLDLFRDRGFKVFIVSGGGVDFMRVFAEEVYGVPPEQVVGSSGKTKFEMRAEGPVLLKLPEIELVDDGPGKPSGIHGRIGRRPIAAFGNSDGDLQMLQWTAASSGPRLMVIVHHDDADREWAYDRTSHIGKLDKALDEAGSRGWTVVSMKNDWSAIFPPVGAGRPGAQR